ncbi:MAG: hypothetical protein JWR44_163 [Hymenobacter sp.]|nr:hypothetical protein [Hymenobacter sp.]
MATSTFFRIFNCFPKAFVALMGVLGLLSWTHACAQAPAWQTAIALGTGNGGRSQATATAMDASGNVFVAGSFEGTIGFGGTTLTSTAGTGSNEVFIAKWSPASNTFVWAQRAGGPLAGQSFANAIVVTGTTIYLAGGFIGASVVFGNTTLTNASPNTADLFVAKLTDAGSTASFVWAQRAGGSGSESASALAVSGSNVYLTGGFTGATTTLGNLTLANADTQAFPNSDAFVAKLTDAGPTADFTWAHRMGGTSGEFAAAIAVNGPSVYVAGSFYSTTATFGPLALANANPGTTEVFVAKLTEAGGTAGFDWVQQAGGAGDDDPSALAVSGPDVYVAGGFRSPAATFGAVALANATPASLGISDAFVAKLTDLGASSSFRWAQRAGSTDTESVSAIAVQGTSVYIAGGFYGATCGFGGITLASPNNYNSYADLFVAKLTDAGSSAAFAWAQQAGGTGEDRVLSLTATGSQLVVSGLFTSPTLTFGSTALTNAVPNSTPIGFLASMSSSPLAARPVGRPAALALHPNPAGAQASLRLPAPAAAAATVTLADALGQAVRTYPVAVRATVVLLDLSGLAPGLYVVRCGAASGKLVVE